MTLAFAIRFEHAVDHHNEHVKAFINDIPVGRMKIRNDRLVFRCPASPHTNFVPNIPAYYLEEPLSALQHNQHVLNNLIPLVVRSYLRNYSNMRAEA